MMTNCPSKVLPKCCNGEKTYDFDLKNGCFLGRYIIPKRLFNTFKGEKRDKVLHKCCQSVDKVLIFFQRFSSLLYIFLYHFYKKTTLQHFNNKNTVKVGENKREEQSVFLLSKCCERKCGREDTPPCQKGVKRLENRQK